MPVPGVNQNVDMLDGLEQQIGQTVQTMQAGQPQRPDGTPITDPAELQAYYDKLRQEGNTVGELGDEISDLGQKRQQQTQNMQQVAPMAPMSPMASKKIFDLKLGQMIPSSPEQALPVSPAAPQNELSNPALGDGQGGMGTNPEPGHTEGIPEKFSSPEDVKRVLLSIGNAAEAAHLFMDRFSNENSVIQDPDAPGRESNSEDAIRDPLNEFFSPQADKAKEQKVQNDVSNFIFNDVLPDSAKSTPLSQEPGEIPADFKHNVPTHISSIIKDTDEYIQKLAKEHAKSKVTTGAFNLKKEAQHKSLNNVMMYGPDQVRFDEFTHQPISNWHLVERNKGFGLRIDDICDIDFEAIWRGTIMDKYDVNYIERRFEVDKNVSPVNDMQLKPGQLRKPYLPEYSSTEARLEVARGNKKEVFNWAKEASAKATAKNADPDNFHPCGKCLLSKPCHCEVKEAQMVDPVIRSLPYNASKKKVVSAQAGGIAAPNFNEMPELPKLDGEVKAKQQQRWCNICYSKMRNAVGGGSSGKNPNECPSCGSIVPTPLTTDPQMGQVQKGEQQKPQGTPTMIQPGTNLSSFGGIFYDGKRFIVYSKKKNKVKEEVEEDKEEFDDFEEAEKFFQSTQPVKSVHQPIGKPTSISQPQFGGGMGAPAPQQMPPTIPQSDDDLEECDIPLTPGSQMDKKKIEVHNSMQNLAIDE
jgi:hypothetical protein